MSKTFMGVRLRRLREERGLTQTAVARALDISNSYLSQIEQNQRPLTVPLLLKLNAVFGVDVQFFSEDEEGRLISDVRDALADGGDEPISTVELRELALNMPAVGRALVSLHRKARQSAERAENQRQHQEQQLQSQQAKIDKDTKDLEAKKAQLEQQKQELAKKKQELEQQSARAQGRNEQLASDESSGIGKLIDKVTGKDAKRQQAKAANDAEQSAAQSDAGSVDQSLENVQQMLDDVDQKLDTAKSVKQDASAALEKAQTAYDENRGTIDAVVSYAKTGAQMLGNLLFQ